MEIVLSVVGLVTAVIVILYIPYEVFCLIRGSGLGNPVAEYEGAIFTMHFSMQRGDHWLALIEGEETGKIYYVKFSSEPHRRFRFERLAHNGEPVYNQLPL
jgi:hypothetical protein